MIRLLRAADYRAMPWRNGGGTTFEVAIGPEGAAFEPGAFAWRLSLALVERDGPFSALPGYDRVLTLVEGAGILLDGDGEGQLEVLPPHGQARFPGERAVTGLLRNGPIRDFNLMTRRRDTRGEARLVEVGPAGLELRPKGAALALHALAAPGFRLRTQGGELAAAAGDTLLLRSGAAGRRLQLSAATPTAVLMIEIAPRR